MKIINMCSRKKIICKLSFEEEIILLPKKAYSIFGDINNIVISHGVDVYMIKDFERKNGMVVIDNCIFTGSIRLNYYGDNSVDITCQSIKIRLFKKILFPFLWLLSILIIYGSAFTQPFIS